MKDAVFASPLFPRLLNGDLIRETIARGVSNGVLGYVGKTSAGYEPFLFGASLSPQEVEISDDVFVITAERAEAYRQSLRTPAEPVSPGPPFAAEAGPGVAAAAQAGVAGQEQLEPPTVAGAAPSLTWTGEVPARKWMNFYSKVLSRFAAGRGLRLTVTVEAAPEAGVSKQVVEETRSALRELGLKEEIDIGS